MNAWVRITIEKDKRYGAPLNWCVVFERRVGYEAIMFEGKRSDCQAWASDYERKLEEWEKEGV